MNPTDTDTSENDEPAREQHERQLLGIFWRASKSGLHARGGR